MAKLVVMLRSIRAFKKNHTIQSRKQAGLIASRRLCRASEPKPVGSMFQFHSTGCRSVVEWACIFAP